MAKNIAKRLNPYLADLAISFYKLHDLHWNVKGKLFVQVHQYTESRYDDMAAKLDEVAEKIIMKGEHPASSLSEYLELASIKELGKESYKDEKVLEEVLKDIKHLKELAVELRASFDEDGEFGVVAMLEDHIAGYEKEIWFLESMMD